MEKKVTVSFTKASDEASRNQKIVEILAGGFYGFLKTNGYLRKNGERSKKIEKILEDSKRLHESSSEA